MVVPAAIALVMLILATAARRGPREALWVGWSLALLVPVFAEIEIRSIPLRFVTIAGIVSLSCFLTTSPAKVIGKWLAVDTLMLLLIASQWMTFGWIEELKPTMLAVTLTDWYLPYLVGRCAIASSRDLDGMTKWMVIPIIIITALTVFESLTHMNPAGSYVGHSASGMQRFGLTRARGPLAHPIYLGMLMALLMPWALWAFRMARHRRTAPRWFAALPVVCCAGVLSSLSRGPALVMIGTWGSLAFFHHHRHRATIALVTGVLGIAMVFGADTVLDTLRTVEREGREKPTKTIIIDGERIEYDGTVHRLLLFKVYSAPIIKGGLLGHGPIGHDSALELVDVRVSSVMESIDNHYIIYTLMYGFLGLGITIAIACCGIYYMAQAARDPTSPTQWFAASLCGSIGMVTLMMFTVWLAPDYRCMWLFSIGCAAAYRAHDIGRAPVVTVPVMQAPPRSTRRLVPGHPAAGGNTAKPAE